MRDEITPLAATDESITLSIDDFNKLIGRIEELSPKEGVETPGRWDDESAYRVVDGEVYEVLHDSRSNPYLKRRGVLVDHE